MSSSYPSFPESVTNSGPETSSSEIFPLDTSFDTRADYDASSSDLDEEEAGATVSAESPAQKEETFAKFVSGRTCVSGNVSVF